MITFKLAISYMKKQKGKTIALLSSIALAVMLIFSMNVIRDSGYVLKYKKQKIYMVIIKYGLKDLI